MHHPPSDSVTAADCTQHGTEHDLKVLYI